ncbi:MAG: anti-sigma factor family protein [Acidobacteriota bacterium]
MNCLGIDQIYLYLEKQLSSQEEQAILNHIAGCQKCREALEERKVFQQAAETLPQWQVPPEFTEKVMQTAFKKWISLKEIIFSFIGGTVLISSLLFIFFISTGHSFSHMLTYTFRSILDSAENFILFLLKAAKIILIFLGLTRDFIIWILSSLKLILSFFSPEILAFLCILSLAMVVIASLVLKKKYILGER